MKQPARRKTKRRSALPLARAVGILAILGVLVSGVTFAALQSQQAKLAGNTIQTATANLQISPDNIHYANTEDGFVFSNLVPGGQPSPISGYTIFLKNAGGTPLALRLAISSTPTNPDNVDLNKVFLMLTPVGGGSPISLTLQSLITAYPNGGLSLQTPPELMPGASAQYTLQVVMQADAMTGSTASIGAVDFSFSGLAQSN